ncbi:hypothetical protein E2562_010226 [Oryza meyeriana var. granulata]|uniref:Uncharacterized protein n=1 Tax=Oryza meyeriana var. granulata TaxID=110450 RepID=A0A6G1EJP1_9ORYZ|nr:hypothetical protein E2562_010226 [Oryza meyeriana var. granulata]
MVARQWQWRYGMALCPAVCGRHWHGDGDCPLVRWLPQGTAVAGGRRRGLTGARCGEGRTTVMAFWTAWSRRDARVVMVHATVGSAVLGPLGAAGGAQPGPMGAAWDQYSGVHGSTGSSRSAVATQLRR